MAGLRAEVQRLGKGSLPVALTWRGTAPSFATPPIVGGSWRPVFFNPSTVIVRIDPEPDSAA
jgi:hypothetical protein